MFNNPNFYSYQAFQPRASILNGFRRFTFSELLTGTQKTLNVINQAIPIFHQIKPLWNNARTIFRIANAINEDDYSNKRNNMRNTNPRQNTTNIEKESHQNIKYNEPVFFL